MTKSELIQRLAVDQSQLTMKDIEIATRLILDHMTDALANGERIEIRGFGSFSLHHRAPRVGRNPRTGETVKLGRRHATHFKPGKELRWRVNQG